MKKERFLIISFVLIFSFSLVSIARAQAMGKSKEKINRSKVVLKKIKNIKVSKNAQRVLLKENGNISCIIKDDSIDFYNDTGTVNKKILLPKKGQAKPAVILSKNEKYLMVHDLTKAWDEKRNDWYDRKKRVKTEITIYDKNGNKLWSKEVERGTGILSNDGSYFIEPGDEDYHFDVKVYSKDKIFNIAPFDINLIPPGALLSKSGKYFLISQVDLKKQEEFWRLFNKEGVKIFEKSFKMILIDIQFTDNNILCLFDENLKSRGICTLVLLNINGEEIWRETGLKLNTHQLWLTADEEEYLLITDNKFSMRRTQDNQVIWETINKYGRVLNIYEIGNRLIISFVGHQGFLTLNVKNGDIITDKYLNNKLIGIIKDKKGKGYILMEDGLFEIISEEE